MDNFIKEMGGGGGGGGGGEKGVEKKRRDYGIGIEMLPREIHLLEVVANHPKLNAYELSVKTGLWKGTFSKVANRLVEMGLLERYQNEDNHKEIFYRVTPLGQKAYEGHYQFHQRVSLNTYEYFRNLDQRERDIILQFVSHYTSYLQEYLK